MQNNGRVPPYNREAEIAILGSVLLNNDCWGEVYATLDAEDIYLESNRRIFDSMYRLFEAGVPVDHITLGGELGRSGDLEKVGGSVALSKLTDAVAAPSNVIHYADIVREASAVRQVLFGAQEVVKEGYSCNGIEQLSANMESLVNAAQNLSKRRMPDSLLGLGQRVLANYEKVEGGYRGIELPWSSMDAMTAGLWPKTITMFVARPGVGKTSVAVICAKHAWLLGKRVLIISPEMSKEEIGERFFVMHSGMDYHSVITGQLPTLMKEKFVESIEMAKDKDGLWIMDADDDLSPRGMDAAIRACQPDLVAVDSIYDIKIKGDRKDRAVGALEWLKRSCKELGYAAIGFAQQNRAAELSEKNGGGARLGTIALADEIGQDAHAVFALEQTKDDKDDKVMKIKPLKLRRGQYKKPLVKVHWDFECQNFEEIMDDDKDDDYESIPF